MIVSLADVVKFTRLFPSLAATRSRRSPSVGLLHAQASCYAHGSFKLQALRGEPQEQVPRTPDTKCTATCMLQKQKQEIRIPKGKSDTRKYTAQQTVSTEFSGLRK